MRQLREFQSTLSEGRATRTSGRLCNSNRFQSTLSEGRATIQIRSPARRHIISIHALRGESDGALTELGLAWRHFNPRSPRGERQQTGIIIEGSNTISIHALRGESDTTKMQRILNQRNFNPRSPRGERPYSYFSCAWSTAFQSTLSEGRATADCCCGSAHATFQSTLSEGRATANISKMLRGGLDRFPNF